MERYVTPAAAGELAAFTARTSGLCAQREQIHTGTRYLYSAYLPDEDTCFCLFQAPSSDAVRALNNLAGFPFDRITDAKLLILNGADASLACRPDTTP